MADLRMSSPHTGRPPLARNLGVILGGVLMVQVVFAVFLFVMAALAEGASASHTDRALRFGAAAAAVGAVVVVLVWVAVRSSRGWFAPLLWTARLLPVAAIAIALVVAAAGGVPWLTVPLAFFATTLVSIVAMVLPQLLASRTDVGAGSLPR